MPESGAVYQPTTVGYTYDSGGGNVDGTGGAHRIRNGFLRIMSRHKISSKKWLEWVLFSVGVSFFVAGLTTMLVNLVTDDNAPSAINVDAMTEKSSPSATTTLTPRTMLETTISSHVEEERLSDETATSCSIALGAAMMLIGLILGALWAWLKFFRQSKSPRSGLGGVSGQMWGGLNPSTDLLVGSTSQYGPVLTELPSQPVKMKQVDQSENTAAAIPLSDQEEETRTLMQDSNHVPVPSNNSNTLISNQIPG